MSHTQYNFKRDFFYEAENAIENSSITFITGLKKCGKTVCLRQLADADENALYINMIYDFDTDEKRNDVVSSVVNSIANGQKIIYLIDDAEYMALPDKDIAKIAGVGVSTVSRVLNNHSDVKDETREKILKIIKDSNYVPNNSARILKQNNTKNIAIKIFLILVLSITPI